MKILVDENIPRVTVETLRNRGHDVFDIRETEQKGVKDPEIWERCQQEGRLLVTTDAGFTQYRHNPHFGVLIVRLRQPNCEKIHKRVLNLIDKIPEQEWPGLLAIAQDQVQRIWRA